MNKIGIFVDRDGVLNRETSDLYQSGKKVTLFDNAADAVALLNRVGKVIVITNQPHVARGVITEDELNKIHQAMIKEFVRKNAFIDAVYYCPHHPEKHHQDIPEWARKYRTDCSCRKPGIGLLQKAAEDFGLDLKKCFIIGDRTVDVMTGKNAGCRTILVKTGEAGNDMKYNVKPDYVCEDIYDAAQLISKIILKEEIV